MLLGGGSSLGMGCPRKKTKMEISQKIKKEVENNKAYKGLNQ